MPIDYSKYPPLWLKDIRPRIMKRANNICENETCDFVHLEYVWSVKYKGRCNWFRDFETANSQPKSNEVKKGVLLDNPKKVKVVLTISHSNHDEHNMNVEDKDLKALCQICHLRFDSKEKFRRIQAKSINK